MLPSTFIIHCLLRSREGWMIQASSTTASAPLRCPTRSLLTTSAAAHSTFGTVRFGSLRARPRTDSTLPSFSSERSTLVPMLPVAPTTTTLMRGPLPAPFGYETALAARGGSAVPSGPVREGGQGMRVMVTGARGKVGRATGAALMEAGQDRKSVV